MSISAPVTVCFMALDEIPVLLILRVCLDDYYYSMIKPLYYHLQFDRHSWCHSNIHQLIIMVRTHNTEVTLQYLISHLRISTIF